MDITVAICTWNRAELLDRTLAEMHQLHIPDGIEWELLVVNNNCTDNTDEVIASHAKHLPIRRLFEPKPGHSNARNCAVNATTGELLLWTDDDVLVDTHWLSEYVKAARDWPKAVFFGGTIDPWLEVELPRWMRRHWDTIKGIFVVRQHGDTVVPMSAEQSPAGANMAFRTDVMRKFHFDNNLGRVKNVLTGADDTDVLERLRQAGYLGVWVGTARVRHFIPAERLTQTYIRNWYIGAGQTYVRQQRLLEGSSWWGVPLWVLRRYGEELSKSLLYKPFHGERWFKAFCEVSRLRGVMGELHTRWREAQAPGVITP